VLYGTLDPWTFCQGFSAWSQTIAVQPRCRWHGGARLGTPGSVGCAVRAVVVNNSLVLDQLATEEKSNEVQGRRPRASQASTEDGTSEGGGQPPVPVRGASVGVARCWAAASSSARASSGPRRRSPQSLHVRRVRCSGMAYVTLLARKVRPDPATRDKGPPQAPHAVGSSVKSVDGFVSYLAVIVPRRQTHPLGVPWR